MIADSQLRFTCRYDGCNEPVWKNTINTKYCFVHKEIRVLERREKSNYNRRLKKMAQNMTNLKCEICKTPMMFRKSKYCSKRCQTQGTLLRKKKKIAVKIIDRKINEIQKLLELIK